MEIRTDSVDTMIDKVKKVPMVTLSEEVRKLIPKTSRDFLPKSTISQNYVDEQLKKHGIKFV